MDGLPLTLLYLLAGCLILAGVEMLGVAADRRRRLRMLRTYRRAGR